MIETLIVADDLSGAADSAIACAGAGAPTAVLVDIKAAPSDATAVAIDINSRTMRPQDAGPAAAAAVAALCSRATRVVYHKIDSTLRGNWAHEIVHLREAAGSILPGPPLAIVAPAFPGAGRTTVGGRVRVGGSPLEETETWKRERLAGPADLAFRLADVGLKVERANLDQVRAGVEVLQARLSAWASAGVQAVVCDAELDADLDAIAGASLSLAQPRMFAGSAGLMRSLVRAQGAPSASGHTRARMQVRRPILIAVGSASQVSHRQFETVARQGGVTALTIAPSTLRQHPGSEDLRQFGEVLDGVLSSGADVAVAIEPEAPVDLHEGSRLAAALAGVVAPRLPRIGALVVTGGETARAILVRSGVSGLLMLGEIEPGVPLGISLGEIAIPVVTKAGAFGNPVTLVRARAALNEEDGTSSREPASALAAQRS